MSPRYPASAPKIISTGAIGMRKILEKYGDEKTIRARTIRILSPSVCKFILSKNARL